MLLYIKKRHMSLANTSKNSKFAATGKTQNAVVQFFTFKATVHLTANAKHYRIFPHLHLHRLGFPDLPIGQDVRKIRLKSALESDTFSLQAVVL